MLSSPHNTRRWERHHVDLPVRIVPPDGLLRGAVPGRGTEISMSGMAVHSSLDLKPGDKMQVQFQTNPSGVTAVVRNRKDDCFGLEFLPELSSGDRTLNQSLNQSKFVCNLAEGGTPESQALARHSCNPKTLLAGLRRKQLEIKQVQREIAALNLVILLLADDEKKNTESSLPRRPELKMRPWPSRSKQL
ncbi:MAG: PilZ domain-containing protein [Candidatus Sulfotelmatobacter sp.]|jgi:hypothetical protein